MTGTEAEPLALQVPGVHDGLRGVLFVDAALRSSEQGGCWIECPQA